MLYVLIHKKCLKTLQVVRTFKKWGLVGWGSWVFPTVFHTLYFTLFQSMKYFFKMILNTSLLNRPIAGLGGGSGRAKGGRGGQHLYRGCNFTPECFSTSPIRVPIYIWPRAAIPLCSAHWGGRGGGGGQRAMLHYFWLNNQLFPFIHRPSPVHQSQCPTSHAPTIIQSQTPTPMTLVHILHNTRPHPALWINPR